MLRALLLRGLLAGLCAGVLAAGFAYAVAEPQVERAIAVEHELAHSTGEPHEEELVSRDVQSTVGLLLGSSIYGVAVGGLFALAFAVVYGRFGRASPSLTSAWLAAAAFVAVSLVPFLKYPANPPGVGDERTIGTRTELYLVLIAISILAALVALGLYRHLRARWSPTAAALGAVVAYAVLVVAAAVALPGVDEVPASFPASLLWSFRLASLGTQLVLWATLGFGFAVAAQRFMNAYRPSGLDAASMPSSIHR